jgi:hypothetical protein
MSQIANRGMHINCTERKAYHGGIRLRNFFAFKPN